MNQNTSIQLIVKMTVSPRNWCGLPAGEALRSKPQPASVTPENS